MTGEFSILALTAISIAFFHTLSGPDHYLPFIMISRARNWKIGKTVFFTIICGLGHVGSSVLLGLMEIAFGLAVGQLELWEGIRGSIIAWLFASFGLLYMVWRIRHSFRNKQHTHKHFHLHTGMHEHEHNHSHDHLHVHVPEGKMKITPWILFTIFIFGPCEPLIPLVMYPAAKENYHQMLVVTLIFALVTISTMVVLVLAAHYSFRLFPLKKLEHHYHTLAGGTIFLCGMGMLFLGL